MLRRTLSEAGRAYIRWAPISYKKGGVYWRFVEPALKAHPRTVTARTRFGGKFICSTQDVIQRYIYVFGIWEPALSVFVASRLREGDTFVDVGANVGYYSLLGSRAVGSSGRVVAIEASPSIASAMIENLKLSDADNIRVVHAAASDSHGYVPVFAGPVTNTGMSTVVATEGFPKDGWVRSERLCEILTAEELRTARIIKIDVEGHEAAVSAGLIPALAATRPDLEVLLEVNVLTLAQQGISAEKLLQRWRKAGFNAYAIDNRYTSWVYATRSHSLIAPRVRGPLEGIADLVLSRLDVEALNCTEGSPGGKTKR